MREPWVPMGNHSSRPVSTQYLDDFVEILHLAARRMLDVMIGVLLSMVPWCKVGHFDSMGMKRFLFPGLICP